MGKLSGARSSRGSAFGVGVLALAVALGCSSPKLAALPENPCDLVSARQVAAATGLEIVAAKRVLSQRESIESGKPGHEPRAGSICSYETRSELGAILVIFPDRRSPLGAPTDASHCGPVASSGRSVSSLGGRAWGSGGTIAVCVGPDLIVWISVQMAHERRASDAAVGVARAILHRVPS